MPDGEAAAIIFGVTQFYIFLYGRKFIFKTDHQALINIFGPKKAISLIEASRLQRSSYFLSAFQYTIRYVKLADNANAVALSRLLIKDYKQVVEKETEVLKYCNYQREGHLKTIGKQSVTSLENMYFCAK